MRFFAAGLIFFGAAASLAQAPEVPHKMQFAGMTLTIRDDARKEIQKDVDALTQHGRYYSIKAERAKTYFPIIEKIFEEEHLPDDFKYLVLQESALVPDAVSVSNAVGFWQFKDNTAVAMGLRVDRDIDERMNLISSTRGAARYLKQNNYMFNNWLYALQSYQMGAGGVQRSVDDIHNGARHMEITSDTYWYVKKFLAHKVAFENLSTTDAIVRVVPYQTTTPKSLKQIAGEVSAQEDVLKEYNKWLKTDLVPVDKEYVVLIPVGKLDGDFNKLVLASARASKASPLPASGSDRAEIATINGIKSIRAKSGETVSVLANRSKISLTSFLKYNDIAIDHIVEPGTLYLLGRKKNKSSEEFYKVTAGDNLWSVSQHSGVKLKRLMKYNRMDLNDRLVAGTSLSLAGRRSAHKPVEIEPDEDVVQLNENESFDWYLKSPGVTVPIRKDNAENITSGHSAFHPEAEMVDRQVSTPIGQTYMVQKGDTYTSISKQYSASVTELLTWNNLSAQDGLKPGQVLCVSGEKGLQEAKPAVVESSRTETTIHVVRMSDTLYSIARQYGVTIRDLMEWNDKKDFTLTVGEKLRIVQK
jgi:membrane-bound lytic murein transglycosylase D